MLEPPSPADLPSARLIELAKDGEHWAAEELFTRYNDRLLRWAHGRLPGWARNAVDTADLVQDTLLGSLRNLPHFQQEGSGGFHCYLRAAVRNRLRDELRRAGNRRRAEEAVPDRPSNEPSPLDVAIGRELLESYEAALEMLDLGDREAIVARIELYLPYAEIAMAMGLPSADAARMKTKRAISKLALTMAAAQ